MALHSLPHRILGELLSLCLRSVISDLLHHLIGLAALVFKGLRRGLLLQLFLFFLSGFPKLTLRGQQGFRNHLPALQRTPHRLCQEIAEADGIREPHVHFRGMHVHVHLPGIHRDMQHTERELVLHQVFLIPLLDGPCHHIAADEPAIDEINLEIPVRAHLHRLAQIPLYARAVPLGLYGH